MPTPISISSSESSKIGLPFAGGVQPQRNAHCPNYRINLFAQFNQLIE
jgi:hypothetical protein